jgi:hypothetical protein
VNGQAQTYVNNNLDVGVTNVGLTFFVDVPTDTSTITFSGSGVEHDLIFDDDLPGFTQVWGQAQNWGLGFQSISGSNDSITYTLNYQITCAQKTTVSISRELLLAYGEERARTRKNARPASASTLLSWSLSRLARGNMELIAVAEGQYIFQGYGILPSLIERRFARPQGPG